MKSNQPHSVSEISNGPSLYKICVGKGCNNQGIVYAILEYLNKGVWLCALCEEELQKAGLIRDIILRSS